jgi:protein-S-isoprenylcysteine O-methyltransferase Ste14
MSHAELATRWLWILWWASWLIAALWSDRAAKRPPGGQQFVYRALAVAGYVLLFGAYRHRLSAEWILWRGPAAYDWAMFVAVVAGLAFTWWARLHLGRLWSSSVGRKAEHRVGDTGPYGLVRHPIYTGIIVASLATALLRGTALALLGFIVLTIGWYVKARQEERFLRTELGADEYAAYARRVPMLVPFI